jgi:hypothetical protein
MSGKTKVGLEIIQVAAILGVLGDILLRQTPWGLNVFLFNLIFVTGTSILLLRNNREMLTRQTIALLGAQLFFSAMYIWRGAPELLTADAVAIVVILSVIFVPKMKIAASVAGVFHYVVGFIWSSLNAFFAPAVLLVSDIQWKGMPQAGRSKHLVAVLRGVVIVTPIIFIFGALFVAADAVYQGMVERIVYIKPETVFTHVLLTLVFAWLSAGYLRGILLGNEPGFAVVSQPKPQNSPTSESKVEQIRTETNDDAPTLPENRTILEHINISDPPNAGEKEAETRAAASAPVSSADGKKATWEWARIDNSLVPAFTLGPVEIGVIFGAIDLLFLSFVIVQVPYLFGGMDLVQNTPDFKLAEYARRGFGELVAVSALVLPILLAAHWLIRRDNPLTEKLFRALAGVQIVLLFVIMASAVQRLVLLTGNLGYGLTTTRLYPMIFMTWLAVVFVWFALTVLRGARQYFAWGALWMAIFVLGATHFLNPDAFTVKTNIALMQHGRPFDARYNSRLSDDALPILIENFAEFNAEDQVKIFREIARRSCEKRTDDWRSLNLARSKASSAIYQYEIFANRECESKTPPPPRE